MGDPYVSIDRLPQIVARSNSLGADILFILSDLQVGHRFITRPVLPADRATMLGGLTAPLGVYAVVVNHEWWQDALVQQRGHGPVSAQIEIEKKRYSGF